MAAYRDRLFPLVIVCLFFISSGSPLPTTSQIPGVGPTRAPSPRGSLAEGLAQATEDYDQLEEGVTRSAPKKTSADERGTQRCDYNACLDDQVPCAVLAAQSNCLCPGLTSHRAPPERPSMRSVSWNGSEVIIQWCAPNSHVTSYVVTVKGQDRQRFKDSQRSGAVGDIGDVAEVCVVAVNHSGASDGACMMYHPRDRSLPLKAGLIGGALGFLLLLLLAFVLWRHKRQSKQEASISMRGAADTQ